MKEDGLHGRAEAVFVVCPSLRELDADDVTALGCEIDFRVSPTVSPGLVKDLRREIEYQIAPDDGHASPIIPQPHYASTASSKFSLAKCRTQTMTLVCNTVCNRRMSISSE